MASFNIPFHREQKDAPAVRLSPTEAKWTRFSEVAQALCFTVCILAPAFLGLFTVYAVTRPYWKVRAAEVEELKKQVAERKEEMAAHNQRRNRYVTAVNLFNQKICLDSIAAPLLIPAKGIRFESVDYQTSYESDSMTGEVIVRAFSENPDLDMLEAYIVSKEKALQDAMPDRRVRVSLQDNAVDPKSGGLNFSFVGTFE
ncbi:MAG: hypothetical protein V1746_00420 [bacterium]